MYKTIHPLVSIVIPSYNQSFFLESTIKSVLSQDYSNIELIVMDGGSTDGSVEILRRYDSRLTNWNSEPDDGQPNAICEGFRRANGKLLTYLNADDLLLPGAVRKVVRSWKELPNAVIFGNNFIIDETGKIRDKIKSPPHIRWISWRLNPIMSQPGTFFTKKLYYLVGGIDTDLQYAFDCDLFLKFMKVNANFIKCNQFLSAFRRHGQQKGHSRRWQKICLLDGAEINRRYLEYRGNNFQRSLAKIAHYCIQLLTLNMIYTLGFRVVKEGRLKSYRTNYTD